MRTVLRVLWGVVAWAWVLDIVLVVLEWKETIEFASPLVGMVVRAVPWLLVFPASRYFGISGWVGGSMWGALVSSVVVGVVTFFVGGILIMMGLLYYFSGASTWSTTLVHARQGNMRYVRQINRAQDTRDIVLRPLTPWFNIPVLPAAYDVQRWTPVHKDIAYFGPDSTKQALADQRARQYRLCTQQRVRLDSLEKRHLLPTQLLPAATRRGAGTLGYLLGPRVWCAPLHPTPEPSICTYVWGAARQMEGDSATFWVEADHLFERFSISLPYPLPATAGKWKAGLSLEQSRHGDGFDYWYSSPQSTVVTITHLDTVAHVIAGTFSGTLYLPYPKDMNSTKKLVYSKMQHLLVRQGRFDVQYTPGVYHMRP